MPPTTTTSCRRRFRKATEFALTEERRLEIDREFFQFYHRRICWLTLNEYGRRGGRRRALAAADGLQLGQRRPTAQWAVMHEQYRPFVMFHQVQATALVKLQARRPGGRRARRSTRAGRRWPRCSSSMAPRSSSTRTCSSSKLREMQASIKSHFHLGPSLADQLAEAVAAEQYELAAKLRDRLARGRTGRRGSTDDGDSRSADCGADSSRTDRGSDSGACASSANSRLTAVGCFSPFFQILGNMFSGSLYTPALSAIGVSRFAAAAVCRAHASTRRAPWHGLCLWSSLGVSTRGESPAISSLQPRECVMLVLTRKQGEQIRIGDDVVITVVRTKGKAVRLGIQAPSHVPVLRGEIASRSRRRRRQQKASGEDERRSRLDLGDRRVRTGEACGS